MNDCAGVVRLGIVQHDRRLDSVTTSTYAAVRFELVNKSTGQHVTSSEPSRNRDLWSKLDLAAGEYVTRP